jgi:hypothetical protein
MTGAANPPPTAKPGTTVVITLQYISLWARRRYEKWKYIWEKARGREREREQRKVFHKDSMLLLLSVNHMALSQPVPRELFVTTGWGQKNYVLYSYNSRLYENKTKVITRFKKGTVLLTSLKLINTTTYCTSECKQ